MNKIKFTNRLFYLSLSATLFFVLFYQAIVATINGNPFGYLPAFVALVLVFLMAMKHEYTQMVLNIWGSVFMILAYTIKILFKYITQSANLEGGFQLASIYMNAVFVVVGIMAILGGRLYIENVDAT